MREIKYQLIWQGAIFEPLSLQELIEGYWEIDGIMFKDFEENKKGDQISTPHKDYIFFAENENDYGIWRQFTGLKDKNGVEIYEGDILKQDFMGIIGYVKFVEKDGAFKIIAKKVGDAGFLTNYTDDWYVVGNTFENRELLENNKKEND